MANLEPLEELGEIIEDLTTSGSPSLKPEQIKNVKRICKSSDVYVKHAYHIVMTQLKKKHAEVRLSAFQIINELFQRSHVFRELLIDDFQIFLELTAETDFKRPLPPPTNVAKTLMESTYRTVEAWHGKFGSFYKNLDLGFKYLKRVKHAELEDLRATSTAERQRAEERERRKQNLLRKKLVRVETQLTETVPDMERCLTERESCFKLLLPHPKEYEVHSTGADSEINSTTAFTESAEEKGAHDVSSERTLVVKSSSSTANVQPAKCSDENSQAAECKDVVGAEGSSDSLQMDTSLSCMEGGRSDCGCPQNNSDHGKIFDPVEGVKDDDDRSNNRKVTYDEGGRKYNDTRSQEKGLQPDTSCQFQNDEEIDNDETQGILIRHGLGTRSYQLSIDLSSTMKLTIHETDDNSVILDKLRESNKEVTHKYLPMINKWLSVLMKCDGMQQKMQQIIDTKRALEASRDKFLELQVIPMEREKVQEKAGSSVAPQSSSFVITGGSSDEDSSDEFEDVPEEEGQEAFIPNEKLNEYGLEPIASTSTNDSTLSQDETSDTRDGIKSGSPMQFGQKSYALADPTSREQALMEMRRRLLPEASATLTSVNQNAQLCQPSNSEAGSQRHKLLQEAPVLPFDIDLHSWGDPTAGSHKIIKSNVGNNHWASKDDDEFVIEGEKGGLQKRTMTFAGKFEPVRWACRAPLPSGQLCPRRDRFKCPFHGKIVARDQTGCPVDPENVPIEGMLSDEGVTGQSDWQEIQKEIEAATGLDLGGKRVKRRTPKEGEKLTQKQKYARLTDLRKNQRTSRARLEEKVLDPKAMKRVAEDMHTIASKKQQEKFGNQFNYAMRK